MGISRQGLGLRALAICALIASFSSLVAAEYIAKDVSQRVRAATVLVHIEYEKPFENQVSWGSGFVIGDGLIMTNAHVVSSSTPIRIYVHNEYLPVTEARVLNARYDPDGKGQQQSSYYDVALLTFATPPRVQLPILPFSMDVALNQDVFAFGYPNSLQPRNDFPQASGMVPRAPLMVSGGIINQVIRTSPFLLMHDALCQNGNSGGPLINSRGEVVGMQTWSTDPDQRNIVSSFAIDSRGLVAFTQASGYQPYIAEGLREWGSPAQQHNHSLPQNGGRPY